MHYTRAAECQLGSVIPSFLPPPFFPSFRLTTPFLAPQYAMTFSFQSVSQKMGASDIRALISDMNVDTFSQRLTPDHVSCLSLSLCLPPPLPLSL